jgi:hypothetical protein
VKYALRFALVRIYGSLVHLHPVCAEGLRQFAECRVLFACLRVGLSRVETRDDSLGHPDRIACRAECGTIVVPFQEGAAIADR